MAQASHETVVDCIRRSGNLVQLTICSATVQTVSQSVSEYAITGTNASRQYSTLPRKLPGKSIKTKLSNPSHLLIGNFSLSISGRPPQPPKRDPRTTLSVGRARARSMVVALNDMGMATPRNGMSEYRFTFPFQFSFYRIVAVEHRDGRGNLFQFIVTDGFYSIAFGFRTRVHY